MPRPGSHSNLSQSCSVGLRSGLRPVKLVHVLWTLPRALVHSDAGILSTLWFYVAHHFVSVCVVPIHFQRERGKFPTRLSAQVHPITVPCRNSLRATQSFTNVCRVFGLHASVQILYICGHESNWNAWIHQNLIELSENFCRFSVIWGFHHQQ